MRSPLRVALVNDYDVIVHGLAAMLAPFAESVTVVELEAGGLPSGPADVALFDTFAGRRYALKRARAMVEDGSCDHVVLYTWDASGEFLRHADEAGVSGVVLKSHTGQELVDALQRVAFGERVGLERVHRGREHAVNGHLSMREQEVLALVALGLTNREIGQELYLSEQTIKTYVRRLYTKLGVRNRAQAALRAAGYDVPPPARQANPSTGDAPRIRRSRHVA